MANISGFDASTVAPNTGFDVLPAGEYDAIAIASEKKATKNGTGEYLKFEFQILNGEYQNRKVWANMNIRNPSAEAQQIGLAQLSSLCRAVNVLTPKDTSELHDKPVRLKLKVKKDETFGDKNEVVAIKPRNAGPQNTPYSAPADNTPPQPSTDKAPWA